MYKILIVEDEPPITRYIKRLIETECDGFEVADTADNGLEALEKIKASAPDLVLTDVKMPVMSGIELVKKIKTDHPGVFTIIISGYQDFHYVKEALKEGVLDYLLKPVDPGQLKSLLDSMAPKLDAAQNSDAVALLKRLMQDLPSDAGKVKKHLDCRYYTALIIRKGALPGRFENKYSSFEENLLPGLQPYAARLAENLHADRFWLVEGRDQAEFILVVGKDCADAVNIKRAAESLMPELAARPNFHTVIYSSAFFELRRLGDYIHRMYNTLDQLTVIGISQALPDTALHSSNNQELPVLSSALENKLAFLISSKSVSGLKSELIKLFEAWEKEARTQMWIEKMLRKIFNVVEKHTSMLSADTSLNIERQLEEALYLSVNLGGVLKCVWDMIEEMICMPDPGCSCDKYDSASLLKEIENYIEKKLSESITLQGICELFGVSQPYLSRIFRKYKNMSFLEYVTNARICAAKRLMAEHREMHLKDIAAIVGYNDPNYFSRIFKSVTGSSPSGFMDSMTPD